MQDLAPLCRSCLTASCLQAWDSPVPGMWQISLLKLQGSRTLILSMRVWGNLVPGMWVHQAHRARHARTKHLVSTHSVLGMQGQQAQLQS